jgi:hypothetical protein
MKNSIKKIHNLPGSENNIVPFDVNYVKRWLDQFDRDIKVNHVQSLFNDGEDDWYEFT